MQVQSSCYDGMTVLIVYNLSSCDKTVGIKSAKASNLVHTTHDRVCCEHKLDNGASLRAQHVAAIRGKCRNQGVQVVSVTIVQIVGIRERVVGKLKQVKPAALFARYSMLLTCCL